MIRPTLTPERGSAGGLLRVDALQALGIQARRNPRGAGLPWCALCMTQTQRANHTQRHLRHTPSPRGADPRIGLPPCNLHPHPRRAKTTTRNHITHPDTTTTLHATTTRTTTIHTTPHRPPRHRLATWPHPSWGPTEGATGTARLFWRLPQRGSPTSRASPLRSWTDMTFWGWARPTAPLAKSLPRTLGTTMYAFGLTAPTASLEYS